MNEAAATEKAPSIMEQMKALCRAELMRQELASRVVAAVSAVQPRAETNTEPTEKDNEQ